MPKERISIPNLDGKDLCLLFKREMARYRFGRLLVGLSGGADSVALLRLLTSSEAYAEGKLSIKAVHCNFSLRGAESDRDEAFCRDLCLRLGVDLQTVRFDTLATAAQRGVSLEVACRDLRYDLFRELMRAEGWERVAVAHHLDDNAETLLLNLMRGSGINGLKGMVPDNGSVFRPLLPFSRARIIDYLDSIGQDFVTDSTNGHTDFRRNFLRLEVLPLLESRWPSARRSIARSAELLRREAEFISSCMATDADEPLLLSDLMASPEPETSVFYYIKDSGGSPEIAAEVWRTVSAQYRNSASGQWWQLAGGKRLSLERDRLEIIPPFPAPLFSIRQEEVFLTPEIREAIKENRNPDVAWFPYPLEKMTVRRAEKGDRLDRGPRAGSALVSKLMKEMHLTRREKESTPIVLSPEGKPAWVAGVRRGTASLIPDNAETAWRMELQKTQK